MRGEPFGRRWAAAATVLAATLAGLLLAEGIVRATNADWRICKKTLYYEGVDLPSLRPDPDPVLKYRMTPGSRDYPNPRGKPYRVTVNSLGARSPERPAAKPAGVFRVVCVGGSNVYGFEVNDDETWPAQLEARLNSLRIGRFEVWNYGAPAYVGRQMARIADEAVDRLRPDLVIVGLTNIGRAPFLLNAPVEPYFARDPSLWLENLPPRFYRGRPAWVRAALPGLMARARLARLLVFGFVARTVDPIAWDTAEVEPENVRRIRDFAMRRRGATSIAFFIAPASPSPLSLYYEGLNLPAFRLVASGLPPEYSRIHPSPVVGAWYAERISDWLVREKIVPVGAAASPGQPPDPPLR